MQEILLASHNKGKLKEFALLLEPLGVSLISAGGLGLAEPEETGASFAENAKLKALAAARAANMPALADDSGIEIAALDKAPGIYSARYAAGDYAGAFAKILAAAEARQDWRARFVCALCLVQPDGSTATYIGQVNGLIAKTPGGIKGFGYDPIFIPAGYDATYAELRAEVKNKISHRAQAFEQFSAVLKKPLF